MKGKSYSVRVKESMDNAEEFMRPGKNYFEGLDHVEEAWNTLRNAHNNLRDDDYKAARKYFRERCGIFKDYLWKQEKFPIDPKYFIEESFQKSYPSTGI